MEKETCHTCHLYFTDQDSGKTVIEIFVPASTPFRAIANVISARLGTSTKFVDKKLSDESTPQKLGVENGATIIVKLERKIEQTESSGGSHPVYYHYCSNASKSPSKLKAPVQVSREVTHDCFFCRIERMENQRRVSKLNDQNQLSCAVVSVLNKLFPAKTPPNCSKKGCKNKVVHFCGDCQRANSYWCKSCCDIIHSVFSDHNVQPLKDPTNAESSQVPRCPEHNKKLRFVVRDEPRSAKEKEKGDEEALPINPLTENIRLVCASCLQLKRKNRGLHVEAAEKVAESAVLSVDKSLLAAQDAQSRVLDMSRELEKIFRNLVGDESGDKPRALKLGYATVDAACDRLVESVECRRIALKEEMFAQYTQRYQEICSSQQKLADVTTDLQYVYSRVRDLQAVSPSPQTWIQKAKPLCSLLDTTVTAMECAIDENHCMSMPPDKIRLEMPLVQITRAIVGAGNVVKWPPVPPKDFTMEHIASSRYKLNWTPSSTEPDVMCELQIRLYIPDWELRQSSCCSCDRCILAPNMPGAANAAAPTFKPLAEKVLLLDEGPITFDCNLMFSELDLVDAVSIWGAYFQKDIVEQAEDPEGNLKLTSMTTCSWIVIPSCAYECVLDRGMNVQMRMSMDKGQYLEPAPRYRLVVRVRSVMASDRRVLGDWGQPMMVELNGDVLHHLSFANKLSDLTEQEVRAGKCQLTDYPNILVLPANRDGPTVIEFDPTKRGKAAVSLVNDASDDEILEKMKKAVATVGVEKAMAIINPSAPPPAFTQKNLPELGEEEEKELLLQIKKAVAKLGVNRVAFVNEEAGETTTQEVPVSLPVPLRLTKAKEVKQTKVSFVKNHMGEEHRHLEKGEEEE